MEAKVEVPNGAAAPKQEPQTPQGQKPKTFNNQQGGGPGSQGGSNQNNRGAKKGFGNRGGKMGGPNQGGGGRGGPKNEVRFW